jgi:nucleoside-diphosphate-sugar epimerase
MKTILVTGHLGLVGRYLLPLLHLKGYEVKGFDLADGSGDIVSESLLEKAMLDCHGIVHLAAVSRVVWGQKDPDKCWEINALSSERILKLAARSGLKPWVLVTSSREVYGESSQLPVTEDMPLLPVNIYGRSKLHMETATLNARSSGINTAIARLANVYGCTEDHSDRVLPAFCKNAVKGDALRVDGFEHLFDFTHIDDTVVGLSKIIELLICGERNLPVVHLLPGIGTTLQQAAQWAIDSANSQSVIVEAASRSYDVAKFIGNPSRAKSLLNWEAKISPRQGISMLVNDFKTQLISGAFA